MNELTDEQKKILWDKATEPPFSGKYLNHKADGAYACAACGTKLFPSDTKLDSTSGWPSFARANEGTVNFSEDLSHFMRRTEVTCAKCGGHLGHIFPDSKSPTGEYYCINSLSLDFNESDKNTKQ